MAAEIKSVISMDYFVGIDFGTSGARMTVIDEQHNIGFERSIRFQSAADRINSAVWSKTLFKLLSSIPKNLKPKIRRIAIDGTSSTVLLCDYQGTPLAPPKLYNQPCHPEVLAALRAVAPPEHIVLSATSSLVKLLSWQKEPFFPRARFLLHQADWLAAQLHGKFGFSDYHNSLKLGFDPHQLTYPYWFDGMVNLSLLPHPEPPGSPLGLILPSVAKGLGLEPHVQICAGTTDSIAAFLASEAAEVGDAVTSLGSTIALKLLSQAPVAASAFGIYSHWFGSSWLVGGASNAGGAVLAHFFSDHELAALSQKIDWSNRDLPRYIPLLEAGERFPVCDPHLQPCLEPRPDNPVEFLQAILISLTQIEVEGYRKLKALGASSLTRVYTAGGGSKNESWTRWRQQQLGVPILKSQHIEAAYGTAKLASGCLGAILK